MSTKARVWQLYGLHLPVPDQFTLPMHAESRERHPRIDSVVAILPSTSDAVLGGISRMPDRLPSAK